MRKRVVRVSVLVLLLAAGAGAATLAWDADRHAANPASVHDLNFKIDFLVGAVADLGLAQTRYVAPGQNPGAWLERFPGLLRQVAARTAELGPTLTSTEAEVALQTFADATSRFAQADALARDNLLLGDTLTASHLLFGEAREAVAAMMGALTTIREAETAALARERTALTQRSRMLLAGVGVLWVIGLLALTPLPSARQNPKGADAAPLDDGAAVVAPPAEARPSIDLCAAADVCTEIARVETTSSLALVLGRAAAIIDAIGVSVWIGAGDELFPAITHGYDSSTLARLGPISRAQENATAAAWRMGSLQTVHGDDVSHAAIVAPMFGSEGCSGVLAVELPKSRERDEATRAVTVMIAAQLSTLLGGWPGASAASAEEAQATFHS